MSRKPKPEEALYVRLPADAAEKLDRAAETLGVRKKDLVAGLVTKYIDLGSQRGLAELGQLSQPRPLVDAAGGAAVGNYSFRAYDPPEVLTVEQAAQLLQLPEATVLALANAGDLPGRKLGKEWRFSRVALVEWLSTPAPSPSPSASPSPSPSRSKAKR